MKIDLTPDEKALQVVVSNLVENLHRGINQRPQDIAQLQKWIKEAGESAHTLHLMLKARNLEPRHHKFMEINREVKRDHPDFYMHIHPLEDLLEFLDNTSANDDPADKTIDCNFQFPVFSSYWGNELPYELKRTKSGWVFRHISNGSACNKAGQPTLYHNLRNDGVSYPSSLDVELENLWNQAAEKGLSFDEVQARLKKLSEWVSNTEKSAPKFEYQGA